MKETRGKMVSQVSNIDALFHREASKGGKDLTPQELLGMCELARRQIALSIPEDHVDFDDVLGKSLFRLLQALPHYDISRGATITTYAYTIIRNVVSDYFKKATCQKKHSGEIRTLDEAATQIDAACETPLEQLIRMEEEEQLAAAIAALPQAWRQTLILRRIGELSDDICAERLNISPTTVRTRVHRAEQHLRKQLTAPQCALEN